MANHKEQERIEKNREDWASALDITPELFKELVHDSKRRNALEVAKFRFEHGTTTQDQYMDELEAIGDKLRKGEPLFEPQSKEEQIERGKEYEQFADHMKIQDLESKEKRRTW